MTRSEYEQFAAATSSGDAGLPDPARMRVLTPDERCEPRPTAEAPNTPDALQDRLRAAREQLARAEVAVRVARDLVKHLEKR